MYVVRIGSLNGKCMTIHYQELNLPSISNISFLSYTSFYDGLFCDRLGKEGGSDILDIQRYVLGIQFWESHNYFNCVT